MKNFKTFGEFVNESKNEELKIEDLSLDLIDKDKHIESLNVPSLSDPDSSIVLRKGQDKQLQDWKDQYKKLYANKGKLEIVPSKFKVVVAIIDNPKYNKWYEDSMNKRAEHFNK